MDRLEQSLSNLTLSLGSTSAFSSDTPHLIRIGRIYSVASPSAIQLVADLLRDYIFKGMPAPQPDEYPCAEMRDRLYHSAEILYGGGGHCGLEGSRTLACIAVELYHASRAINEPLADAWKVKLGKDAQEAMERLWNRVNVSKGIANDAITELEIRTATTADLYAKGLLSHSRFKASVKCILGRATTPPLYAIFMCCFIMRGLTDTAPKISPGLWAPIREQWFAIERSFDTSAYKAINNVLFAFGEDAQLEGQAWCGLPFCEEVEYGEMEGLCEKLAWDAKGYLDGVEGGKGSSEEICVAMNHMSL